MEAYLDNAATTRVFPEVCDIMVKMMEEEYGNPSSRHTKGIEAERQVRQAAEKIAASLKCQAGEIIFTSGGTEANNLAFLGTVLANRRAGKHIITTQIEHPSVYEPLVFLEKQGYEVTYLPVDSRGRVSLEALSQALREDTLLVSVMYVNNEIGAVQDIARLGKAIHGYSPQILFHVDAIQAYGKYRIIPRRLGIDLMSASGHKLHGPKGTGFLYVGEGVKISPILFGGGQQRGMRSGTENVPGIAGLGEAVRLIYQGHSEKQKGLYQLKERLVQGLQEIGQEIGGVRIHGMEGLSLEETAPHIVSAGFQGIKSEVLLNELARRGVYVSSGSACSSNHPALSGTLQAVGVSEELLDSTLRFSISVDTVPEEIEYALKMVREALPTLRRFVKK